MQRGIVVLFFFVLSFAGCSGSGNAPVTLSNDNPSPKEGLNDSLPIIDGTTYADGTFRAIGLMGAYELHIDPTTLTADLVAKRTPTIGLSWTVSGSAFFTISPCADCLKIESISLTMDNYLQLHWRNRHPFPLPIPNDPPSATNRLDLHVFDLAAVVVPIDATPEPFPLTGTDAYVGVLSDNAGYTTELASLVGDSNAMPYALIVDDNLASTNTFNQFNMGIEANFDTFFNLDSDSGLNFDVYLSFGYGQSAVGKNQRLTPKYFNPEFNKKQAWKVVVTPPQGSDPPAKGNTWSDDDNTTPYYVKVEAFDWQHGVTTIRTPPEELQLEGDIAYASDVASVTVEIPGLTTSIPLPTDTTPEPGGTGAPDNPLVYNVPVVREGTIGAGEHYGLVKVTDTRVPASSAPGVDGIDFLIHSPNGVDLINYSIAEYATYQTFIATVVSGNLTPTCTLELSDYNPGAGQVIRATATAQDLDGQIMSYEYDTDHIPPTFNPDPLLTQNLGDPDFGDPVDIAMSCNTTGSPIPKNIALRVTDDGATPLTDIDIKQVSIGTNLGDLGDLKVQNIMRGGGTNDPELITGVWFQWFHLGPGPYCAAEYVLERADGFNPTTWTFVASAGNVNSYTFVPDPATNDLDDDIRFRVRARVSNGVNSPDDSFSEHAFLLFMSNGGNSTGNLWSHRKESTSSYFEFRTSYFSAYNHDGWPTSTSSYILYAYAYTMLVNDVWAVAVSPEIPDLAGQSSAFCDGYWNFNYLVPANMGMVVGTLSSIPDNGSGDLYDFEPSYGCDPIGYDYNLTEIFSIQMEFGAPNASAWGANPIILDWRRIRFHLPALLTANRDYIAFGMAKGIGGRLGLSNAYSDAWVFVVY